MTEAEWLACDDIRDLLYLCESRLTAWSGGDRTPRLLACAACRLEWDAVTDPRARAAVEAAELYCEGGITRKALGKAHQAAMEAFRDRLRPSEARLRTATAKASRPRNPVGAMIETLMAISSGEDNPWCDRLAWMFRDVFGPRLFRPVAADPAWLSPAAVSIAAGIYEHRAFDRLPVLADALEEAGCADADVLLHCRTPGEHVRGCWVVDLVLGKS